MVNGTKDPVGSVCQTCARNEFQASLFTRTKQPKSHALRARAGFGRFPVAARIFLMGDLQRLANRIDALK
jgi:hypothetical protein